MGRANAATLDETEDGDVVRNRLMIRCRERMVIGGHHAFNLRAEVFECFANGAALGALGLIDSGCQQIDRIIALRC